MKAQLDEWVRDGLVEADNLIFRDGWAKWRAASDVFPVLAIAVVPPASASTVYPILSGQGASTQRNRGTPRAGYSIVGGFIFLIMGVAMFMFASAHSPNISLGEALMRGPDHWVLRPPFYYTAMILAAIFGIGGLLSVIQGFIIQSNKTP